MAFGFFTALLINAVFFVIAELLRPKPDFEDAESIPYEDANFPSVDPGKKQGVFWGKVDLRSPHVMDLVEYRQIEIVENISTGLFSDEDVVIGFRYFVSMQLGLTKSLTTLHKIFVDDRSVPLGSPVDQGDDGLVYTINEPDFLGGRENGGGLAGTLRLYKGTQTQNPNALLGTYRTDNPAYRWTSYVMLENFEVGESPNIDAWAFQVSRYPDPFGIGANNTIGVDINPMSIIGELLFDDDFGFGLVAADVDFVSFTAAAATLKTEGIGMSLKWVNNQSVDRLIETVNKQVDGVFRYNPSTGKWEYKLVRDDFVIGNLLVLDETNIKDLTSYSRAAWDETLNGVEIKYSQRDSKEKPAPASAEDRSNFTRQGRQKTTSFNFPGCYSSAIANELAARELKSNAFPLASVELVVDRVGFDLLPGDAFVFEWGQLGISQLVMRVGDIGFGTDDQLELNITAIEDIFSLATSLFSVPPATGFNDVVLSPQAITIFDTLDTPYIFAQSDSKQDPANLLDTAFGLAAQPQGNALRYLLEVRQSTDPFIQEASASYVATGTLQTSLAESSADPATAIVIEDVINTDLISTDAVTQVLINDQYYNLAVIVSSVDDPYEQLGASAKYLPEYIAYEDASIVGSTVTLTNVHRGMLDTLPAGHAVSDRIWFVSGVNTKGPSRTLTKLADTETLDVRYRGVATTGQATPTATELFTARNRPNLPYPGGNLKINTSRYPTGLVSVGGDIDIEWNHRNRLANSILYQTDATDQQFGTGVPEDGFEYILEIYRDDGTETHLRRVVATGSSIGIGTAGVLANFPDTSNSSYDYTNALQITDGGPFSTYRIELRVTNSGLTTNNLIDVIRTVNVDIPLDLTARGPIYETIVADTPTVYFPFGEDTGNFADIRGVSADATKVGTVYQGVLGPDGITTCAHIPGAQGNYIAMADESWNDLAATNNVCMSFFFRCGPVDGVSTYTPIATNMSPTAITPASSTWLIYLDTLGRLRAFHRPSGTAYNLQVNGSKALDDGEWHHVWCNWFNGGNVLVDGQYLGEFASGGSFSQSNTRGITLGGHNDATAGDIDIDIAHFVVWDDVGHAAITPNGSTGAQLWLPILQEIYARAFLMNKSPYLRAIAATNPGVHYEMDTAVLSTDSTGGGGMLVPAMGQVWSGNGLSQQTYIGADNNVGVNKVGPLVGQRSVAIEQLGTARCLEFPSVWMGRVGFGFWEDIIPETTTDFSFSGWIYIDSTGLNSAHRPIWNASTSSTGQRRCGFFLNASEQLEIYANSNGSNGTVSNAVREISDDALATDTWYHVAMVTEASVRGKIYVNGKLVPSSETVGGSPAVSGEFIDNIAASAICVISFFGSNAILASDNMQEFSGKIAHFTFWGRSITAAEIASIYAAAQVPELSMTEMLSRDNPQHLYALEDETTGNADQFDNSADGDATQNGTFVADRPPFEVDNKSGRVQGVQSPIGFNGTEGLGYATQILGTGDFSNFTLLVVLRPRDNVGATTQVVILNSDATDANYNIDMLITAAEEIQVDKFPPANGSLISTDLATEGVPRIYSYIEDGANRSLYFGGDVESSDAASEAYTGLANSEFWIGERGSNDLGLYADVAYVGVYSRATSPEIVRRAALRFAGRERYTVAVLQHGGDFLCLMNEDPTQSGVAHNSALVPIRDLGLNGTPLRAYLDTGPVGNLMSSGIQFVKASSEDAQTVNPVPTSAPWTFGGWFRLDTALDDAYITLSNSASDDAYISVGLFSTGPGFKIGAATAVTSGVVTQGDWVHIVVRIESSTVNAIYVNGVGVTSNQGNTALPTGTDIFSVNSRVELSGTTYADGSYAGVFVIDKALSFAEVAEIYSESILDISAGLVLGHPDNLMFYPLDEYIDDQLTFHDNADRTVVGTGTGMAQGQIGIVPQRQNLCVDFDGAGDIDLARIDYPAGSVNRVIEFWVDGGFEGIVCSMGANVDGQSLTVAIDNAGDVRVHIRGTGNERIFTAALDAGTEHHVAVELNGTTLTTINCYVNGVLATVGTAGSATTMATTATENLVLGTQHANLTTLPNGIDDPYIDATGKLQNFAVYDAEWGATTTDSAVVALQHNDAGRF